MSGIKFGSKHSYDYFGFVLTDMKISAPEVYTKYIEIPGKDGALDLSDAFGETKYKMRKASFEFALVPNTTSIMTRITDFTNHVHGRSVNITLDEDPDYYYEARCFVEDYVKRGELVKLSVKADLQPYKLKNEKTVRNETLSSGTTTIICRVGRMSTIPTIKVKQASDITVNGIIVSGGRTTIMEDLVLKHGSNAIEIKCSGTTDITIEYQEGDL